MYLVMYGTNSRLTISKVKVKKNKNSNIYNNYNIQIKSQFYKNNVMLNN